MNAGIEIDLTGGNFERFSLETMVLNIGGNDVQFDGRILELNQTVPLCQQGDHEVQSFTAILADGDGELRESLLNVYGKTVKLYDETGTQQAKLIASRPDFSERGKAKLICSDRFQETEGQNVVNQDYEITAKNFPQSPESSNGKYYNFFSGEFQTWDTANFPGQNGLRCYLSDSPVSGTGGVYVIGKAGTITGGKMPAAPTSLVDDSGNTLVATGWSIALDGADGLWKITKAGQANFQYIDINIKLTSAITLKEIFQDISDEFFVNFPFTATPDARELFAYDKRHLDPEPSLDNDFRSPRYFVDSAITGTQILKQICMDELNYYITPAGEITFTTIDYGNIGPEVYQDAESFEFIERGNQVDPQRLTNEISIAFGRQPGGEFARTGDLKDWESRYDRGFFQKNPGFQNHIFGTNSRTVQFYANGKPVVTSIGKRILTNSQNAFNRWTFNFYNLQLYIDHIPGDYLKFSHVAFPEPEPQTMMVLRKRANYKENTMEMDLQNITELAELDTNQIFLFQMNPPQEGYIFFDDISVSGYYYTSSPGESGQVVQTLTDKKFTRGSVKWNGINWSKSVGTVDLNAAWQVFSFAKWCFAAWIKFPVLGSVEIIMRSQDPADTPPVQNSIDFRKRSDNKLQLSIFEGGVQKVMEVGNTVLSANTWYHLMFVKNGSNVGWYVNGSQDSHGTPAYTPGITFSFPLFFAQDGLGGNFAQYTMAELGIWSDANGPFLAELSPDAGLTDTYTVPTGAVTRKKGKFINHEGIS